jgi:hypothetical protein
MRWSVSVISAIRRLRKKVVNSRLGLSVSKNKKKNQEKDCNWILKILYYALKILQTETINQNLNTYLYNPCFQKG